MFRPGSPVLPLMKLFRRAAQELEKERNPGVERSGTGSGSECERAVVNATVTGAFVGLMTELAS